MKRIIFFILICFFSFGFSQKKYSINEILKTSPLNKATKVKIIAYNTNFISEVPTPLPPIGKTIDSAEIKRLIANQRFPIKLRNIVGKENIEEINQSKILNFTETIELFQLLFNTCGKFTNNVREVSKCFFPRNAILFYDENDKVFDFIEICFECKRIDYLSDNASEINYMCDNFYQKLENYFHNKGLQTQYIQK